jgi:hypothetical protein
VSGAPVSAWPVAGSVIVHAPVATMVKPVMEHTTMVSMKVCVMDTRAWLVGACVCAAAAAMPPVPRPDSLEKTPRAKPQRIASRTVTLGALLLALDEREPERVPELAELEPAQPDGEVDPGPHEEKDHREAPDHGADRIERAEEPFHNPHE